MRVLTVHNFYQQFGGEDAAYLADLDLLKLRNVDVVRYERHNDEIKNFGMAAKARFPLSTMDSPQTRADVGKLVSAQRPDVAYVHNVYPLISPSIYHALHGHGIPVVQVMHDFRPLCPNGWFYTQGHVCEKCAGGNTLNAVRFRCYKDSYVLSAIYAATMARARRSGVLDKVTAFVCPTEFMQMKIGEAGVELSRTHIKPHYMETMDIAPSPGRGEYVLYLGRLSSEKGVWTLLAAAAALPDIPFSVAGTGPLERALSEAVKERKLGNVTFHGFVSGPRKHELIAHARMLVVPSECYETFGMVVLESYVRGKPVVAARIGSLPYIVEDNQSGLLFDPGDGNDLARCIKALFNDEPTRRALGVRARELAETRFGKEMNANVLMRILGDAARTPV